LVFFDVDVKGSGSTIILSGVIGTTKLKNKFIRIINRKKIAVVDNIKTLSDPNDHLEIGWGKSLIDQDIHRSPDEQPKLATHVVSE